MSKKKIILHLITTLDMGGAEGMLLKLLGNMDRDRFTNHVISLTNTGPIGKKLLALGIPVYSLGMPSGRITWSGLLKLWKLLRKYQPEILQTWLYHSDLLGLILGKLAGIKCVFWNIRCSYMDLTSYRPGTRWTVRLCMLLSRFSSLIITNSKEAMRFHVKMGYDSKRWMVIPNGFDTTRFKSDKQAKISLMTELGLNDILGKPHGSDKGSKATKTFFIGFISRLDPMKDHSTFIKAAEIVLKERDDVNFILAGKGVESGNKSLIDLIPVQFRKHFHLLGERDDIEYITASLDVASSVSHGEGFSNTIGEAMASGVPCVATDVGESSEIVGDTGYVVPSKDPHSLSRAWISLLDMSSIVRRDLGIRARNRVVKKYSIGSITKEYEKIYHAYGMAKN